MQKFLQKFLQKIELVTENVVRPSAEHGVFLEGGGGDGFEGGHRAPPPPLKLFNVFYYKLLF